MFYGGVVKVYNIVAVISIRTMMRPVNRLKKRDFTWIAFHRCVVPLLAFVDYQDVRFVVATAQVNVVFGPTGLTVPQDKHEVGFFHHSVVSDISCGFPVFVPFCGIGFNGPIMLQGIILRYGVHPTGFAFYKDRVVKVRRV
jgi:hypothetical protein